MLNFKVLTPLRGVTKKPVSVGEVVACDLLDPAEAGALVAMGALEPTDDAPTVGDVPAPPLAKMNKAQLLAVALAEQIIVPETATTNAGVIAVIEAARKARAAT